jgi:methyl-accepting chemotaxis protein
MEELGVGGFMGVQDVREGMKLAVSVQAEGGKRDFFGEVVSREDKAVTVLLDDKGKALADKKGTLCQLRIVVDNVLYSWEEVSLHVEKQGGEGRYVLLVDKNPQVFNRRKYPRMPFVNKCSITLKGEDAAYDGKMVNISANGFAFSVRNEVFAECKGKQVLAAVNDFAVLGGKPLVGRVIRSSDNEGEFIVGCRMPEDSEVIRVFVSQNYSE